MKKIISVLMSIIMILPLLITSGVPVSAETKDLELILHAQNTTLNDIGTMTIALKNNSSSAIKISKYIVHFNEYFVTKPDGSYDDLTKTSAEAEPDATKIPVAGQTFASDSSHIIDVVDFKVIGAGFPVLSVDVYCNDDTDVSVTGVCQIPVNDPSNITKPDLVIDDIATRSTIEAGSDFTLSVYLKNNGDSSAKNIYVTVSNYDSNTFYPKTINADVSKDEIASNDRQCVNIGIRTNTKLPTGTYPLDIAYSYQDKNGTMQSGIGKCYVNIKNPDPNAGIENTTSLTLTSLSSSVSTVNSGEDFTLSFDISNLSKSIAKNVNIGVNNYTTETFIPTSLNTVTNVGDINASSKKAYSIKIGTSSVMKTGHFPLEIGYTYIDGDSKLCTGTYTTFISVLNPKAPEETPEGIKTTPRIILDNYSLDVDNVVAGKPFTFNFTLKNTNTKVNVSNMKISVESTDAIFTPVQGSNSFYTATLATGQSEDYSISLTTKSGCEPKSYPVLIKIDYEDTNGTPYSSTENINLLVTQPIRVEITDFNVPSDAPMGMPINISFRYFNKGKTPLNNFSICMEGDFTMEQGDEYIGALGASSYDEYQGMIYGAGTGEQNGTLVLKFEDSTGAEQRIEQPFTINVSEESFDNTGVPMFPDGGEGQIIDWDKDGNPIFAGGDKASEGLAWWAITLICIGSAAIITVVVIFAVKKVHKKKQKALEDDDDDYDDDEE